jgi:MFS transporter
VKPSRLRAYVPDRGAGRSLALMALIDSIGTGLFLAGAAIFFIRFIGLTTVEVGLGLSVGGAVGLVTVVPAGVLGDRVGPRRLLVLLQLWRAAVVVSMLFVSDVVSFTVVASLLAIADCASPSLTQAVVSSAVADDSRVRNMAILRSTRNVGFSVGALLAAPLIGAASSWSFRAVMLGDAVSFMVAALILSRVTLARAPIVRRTSHFLTALFSFRDWPYVSLAALNGVLTLHMTILMLGIPLWLIHATSVPAGLVGLLLLLNTIMAVVLQVPLSRHATVSGGSARVLRLAGVMLAGCSVSMAIAAHVAPGLAIASLVLATVLMSLAEIWQSAGAWELSYRFAQPERQVQYLAVFSFGGAAQEVLGPVLLTAGVIGSGTAGWLGLAALFLVTTLLVRPATTALQRSRLGRGGQAAETTPASAMSL